MATSMTLAMGFAPASGNAVVKALTAPATKAPKAKDAPPMTAEMDPVRRGSTFIPAA